MSRARNLASSSSARRVSALARAADQALDLAGDPLRLLFLVVGLEALDPDAAGVVRPQLLVLARRVARDDGMGGVEDQLGRPVVLLELDDRGVGPVALEVEDVAQVRAAPRVDRLVVVADDAQVAVLRRERPDPQVLRPVRVLVLVDVEVAPALLVPGRGRRAPRRRAGRPRAAGRRSRGRSPCAAAPGSAWPAGRWSARGGWRRARLRNVGVEHLVLGPADRPEDHARAELAGQRQVLLAQDLLHQGLLVVGVVDDEPAADPDRLAVLAQDPGAERMERPGHDVPATLADQADDPLAQLGRRTVGEGDREDPPRGHVLDARRGRRSDGPGPGSCRSRPRPGSGAGHPWS